MSPSIKKIIMVLAAGLVSVSSISLTSCGSGVQNKVQLKISNADSLMIPFQAIAKEFEAKYPNIQVALEEYGSIQVVRSVTELDQNVDLASVADYQLIPLLMYQAQMPNNGGPYANWNIEFATNKLGIAYTNNSRYSSEINNQNWYDILSRPDVRLGLADPLIDSLGYRTLIAIELAQNYYNDSSLFQKLIMDNFSPGFEANTIHGITTIKVPALVEPTQARISLRGYSIELLALLQSGDIDYTFEYESVAKQQGLQFLELPPEIDLSSQDYVDQYQQIKVDLGFQRFATVTPQFVGSQIIYGITIPRNAPHPKEAEEFLEFLLGSEGQRILAENYQPSLIPPTVDDVAKLPEALQLLLK
jgi:molybdate/tungstate transport system substrate-binding protein